MNQSDSMHELEIEAVMNLAELSPSRVTTIKNSNNVNHILSHFDRSNENRSSQENLKFKQVSRNDTEILKSSKI